MSGLFIRSGDRQICQEERESNGRNIMSALMYARDGRNRDILIP